MQADAVLRDKVFMRLLPQTGQEIPVLAHMAYDPQDPYAVTVNFTHGGWTYAEWRLDRDMLRDALEGVRGGAVGEGDVRVWPEVNGTREELCIELMHSAVFTVWAPSLRGFLDRTYAAVPAGEEHVELDAFLEEVLSSGSR
ncbi:MULTISPECIES: SsgA family sporulation/cell division regulator [unclassified Streptomyces]|uniref:SsgA family sporulation/cell division regulator n=1 Tax=unclassified Streptomyces TaxID=2593676 RepID=UPI0033ABCBF6